MGGRRAVARVVASGAIVVGAGVLWVVFAPPSDAQVAGPCIASIKGESPDQHSSPDTAIRVNEDEDVVVSGSMSARPVTYSIALRFYAPIWGAVTWTVKHGETDSNEWSDTVNVADYAKYGTGLYLVHAESEGERFTGSTEHCTADAFIKVEGRSPVQTPIGLAALGAGVAGVAAVGVASTIAAREGQDVAREIERQDQLDSGVEQLIDQVDEVDQIFGCLPMVVVAIGLTVAALVRTSAHGLVVAVARWLR